MWWRVLSHEKATLQKGRLKVWNEEVMELKDFGLISLISGIYKWKLGLVFGNVGNLSIFYLNIRKLILKIWYANYRNPLIGLIWLEISTNMGSWLENPADMGLLASWPYSNSLFVVEIRRILARPLSCRNFAGGNPIFNYAKYVRNGKDDVIFQYDWLDCISSHQSTLTRASKYSENI